MPDAARRIENQVCHGRELASAGLLRGCSRLLARCPCAKTRCRDLIFLLLMMLRCYSRLRASRT
jgi:hypothetical protein